MKRLKIVTCLVLLTVISLALFMQPVLAQGEGEESEGNETLLDKLWKAIEDLGARINELLNWKMGVQTVTDWLNSLWGGFVGSVEMLINWLWEQFYNLFIAPVVEGFKAAVSTIAATIRASIDGFVGVITVQIPYWFVGVFGPWAPVVAALILGLIVFGMYFAVKMVITLL